jgi:Regulatory CLIP domain of proteinases
VIEIERACETPDLAPGMCMAISKCASLLELFKPGKHSVENERFLERSHCGFNEHYEPVVCCANETQNRTLPLPIDSACGWSPYYGLIREQRTKIDDYPWTALILYETRKSSKSLVPFMNWTFNFQLKKTNITSNPNVRAHC